MASVIAMVGEKRSMAENAMMMIHNPWTVSFGEAEDMRKSADLLDKLKENIISAYAGRTGIKREELGAMMDEETWMTAKEAKDFGFITDITERLNVYNSFERFDISQFAKRPRNFMSKKPEAKPEDVAEIPAVVETPVLPENKAEDKVTLKIDASEFRSKLDALTSRIEELGKKHKDEIDSFEAKLSAADAKLQKANEAVDQANEAVDRLERSYGLAAAKVIVETPVAAEQKSLIDQYNEITGDAEKTAFFQQHKAELQKFINYTPKA
jgi:hypothetical protein